MKIVCKAIIFCSVLAMLSSQYTCSNMPMHSIISVQRCIMLSWMALVSSSSVSSEGFSGPLTGIGVVSTGVARGNGAESYGTAWGSFTLSWKQAGILFFVCSSLPAASGSLGGSRCGNVYFLLKREPSNFLCARIDQTSPTQTFVHHPTIMYTLYQVVQVLMSGIISHTC